MAVGVGVTVGVKANPHPPTESWPKECGKHYTRSELLSIGKDLDDTIPPFRPFRPTAQEQEVYQLQLELRDARREAAAREFLAGDLACQR